MRMRERCFEVWNIVLARSQMWARGSGPAPHRHGARGAPSAPVNLEALSVGWVRRAQKCRTDGTCRCSVLCRLHQPGHGSLASASARTARHNPNSPRREGATVVGAGGLLSGGTIVGDTGTSGGTLMRLTVGQQRHRRVHSPVLAPARVAVSPCMANRSAVAASSTTARAAGSRGRSRAEQRHDVAQLARPVNRILTSVGCADAARCQ